MPVLIPVLDRYIRHRLRTSSNPTDQEQAEREWREGMALIRRGCELLEQKTTRDELLERFELAWKVLFPAPIRNEDGSWTIRDADRNLDAAIYDIERLGKKGEPPDAACYITLKRVHEQLLDAKKIMEGDDGSGRTRRAGAQKQATGHREQATQTSDR